MVDPSSSSTNAPKSPNAIAQPPAAALVADDDDEPPSSGPRHDRHAQVNGGADAVVLESPRFPPIKTRDTLYLSDGDDPAGAFGRSETVTTLAVDLEKQDHLRPQARIRQSEIPGRTGRDALKPVPLSRANRIRALFTPNRDIGPRPTYLQSFKAIARYSFLNILLVFIPVSWAMHYSHQSSTLTFVFSCLAIIPLAALLGLGTEQVALRTSQSVGGLLNATLGNVIEMIIAGIALKQCELGLVQSALLGGLISNLLLVLGCAFMIGGFNFPQQEFQPMVAQLNSSLLIVSVISLIIPAAFHLYLEDKLRPGTEVSILLMMSRGSAIILILIYFAYLFFQFYSHNHLFLDTVQHADTSSRSSGSSHSSKSSALSRQSTASDTLAQRNSSRLSLSSTTSSSSSSSYNVNQEHLRLNAPVAFGLLVTVTVFAFITAEALVDSLEGLVRDHPNVSKEWITFIIIPVVSNAAEHATAVIVARKGKFDLAMTVAVGSCIQIALFVIPLLIMVAWGMGKPLMLLFDPLETIILFFSVIAVKFAIEDGRSHWMSGLSLVGVYVIIALSFWHFPDTVRLIQGSPLPCTV